MKITRKLEVPVTVVEDVFCNKCGVSCKSPQGDFYGLIEAVVQGGYSSVALQDGDVHKFSLCEFCLSDLIKSFMYASLQGNCIFPDGDGVDPDFNTADYGWPKPTREELIEFFPELADEEYELVDASDLLDPDSETYDVDLEELDNVLSLPAPRRVKKEDMN